MPRTCAQSISESVPRHRNARRWRGGHDSCTAVDVPLTAPRTAGAGDRSNASSENPAARSWRSDAPQKPNISAQSAQNMSSASDSQWQQNVISVCGRELMLKAPAVQFRLINMTMHPESGKTRPAAAKRPCRMQRRLASYRHTSSRISRRPGVNDEKITQAPRWTPAGTA